MELLSVNQFIWHFLAFIVFAWVLYKFAWKPILGTIDARKDAIETSFADIEKKQAEVARLQEKYETQLREIQEETTRRIQDAIKHGDELAQKIRADAEAARDKILEKARADIDRERAIASAELRNQVVELSILISEKLLKDPKIVTLDVHKHLLERYLAEVEGVL
jgi:F-type H+-transporting ATPase subunit b